MMEAIAEIAEAAQEVAVNLEECRISINVIEDMKDILKDVAGETSKVPEAASDAEAAGTDVVDLSNTQLDSRSTYFKDGHSFETDDRGTVYKKDGEFIPGVEYTSNGGKYKVDAKGNVETLEEGYQSTYKDRLNQTPAEGERGKWTGERGESRYIPNAETEKGAKAAEKLSEYDLEGEEYQDAIPDFSECSEESVEIDMTEKRYSKADEGVVGNFEKADTKCAKKWNSEGKGGRTDWTPRDIANYRKEHNMTWHECADRKTCHMLSRDIHDYFGHSGGVSECKKSIGQNVGGGFDA